MRLSHLSAVAVLAALVAAMFVALQSVSAAACVANPDITLGFDGTCEIDVGNIHDDATTLAVADGTDDVVDVTAGADGDVTTDFVVTADEDTTGTKTLNILGSLGEDRNVGGTGDDADEVLDTIDVTVAGFGIVKVEIVGDSDNVVSAGPTAVARVTTRSQEAAAVVMLTVPTTGLSIANVGTNVGTTTQALSVPDDNSNGIFEFTVNTAGAPAGDYVLTFTASNDASFETTPNTPAANTEATDEVNKQEVKTLTLTIGDPGTGLASATLSLGNSSPDLPYTDGNEAVAETGAAAAKGGSINLVVEVFDSLGGKANSGSINQIIVIAPGGKITTTHNTGAGTESAPTTVSGSSSATLNEQDAADGAPDAGKVGQRTVITVGKTDEKPGQVTVYAIVSGPGGAARTEDVTLVFSGPAASLSIADATESLLSVNPVDDPATTGVDEADEDELKLLVTAEDSGGNVTDPPISGVSIVITDPDGKRQGSSIIGREWPTMKSGDGKYYITLTGMGSEGAPLKAGNWTLKATKGTLEAEATFAVAGAPADVAVSASATSSDNIGDVITVTASVTDKDGNTVSDGTSVMFDVSEDTGLAAIGTGHAGKATKNGEASVKYAVVGAGHSVVSATAGGATGVIVIDSTAGATDMAMPEEEASVACLSSLSGFATWACGVESSASEIFGLVSGRGATALHLWNGSAWVRYSVVDGTMVPGSSDFMVAENDILYISN